MDLTDYELILLAVGLVGVYVKLHGEVTKLTSRVYSLENGNKKIERSLEQLATDLAEIKLLLARNQMDK
jgi:dihydroorotase